jgi:hypothetical protein
MDFFHPPKYITDTERKMCGYMITLYDFFRNYYLNNRAGKKYFTAHILFPNVVNGRFFTVNGKTKEKTRGHPTN